MAKNTDGPRISLKLLKQLVTALESGLEAADKIRENKTDENLYDFIIEMQKCSGLAAGIADEGKLLMRDVAYMVKLCTQPSGMKEDPLAALLGLDDKPGRGPDSN